MNQNELIGIPADCNERKFTGIWIPAEIWRDDSLSALAKMLYAEIASFGERGCWKKSEDLMSPLGIGRSSFQNLCRALRENGYITEKRKFGRIVRTTTLGFSTAQKSHQCEKQAVHQAEWQADEQAVSQAVHKEYRKEYVSKETRDKNVAGHVEKSFGREDINALADLWQQETGFDIKGEQAQRRQLYNLVRKYGMEKTRRVIQLAGRAVKSNDRFAPSVTKPAELVGKYEKLSKLIMWQNRNNVARQFGNSKIVPAPVMATASIKRVVPDYGGAFDVQSDEEREKVREIMRKTKERIKK